MAEEEIPEWAASIDEDDAKAPPPAPPAKALPAEEVPSWARPLVVSARGAPRDRVAITFHNSDWFETILYVADWTAWGSEFRGGGQTVSRDVAAGESLRVAFGASLGDYCRDQTGEMLVGLEFSRPGHYVAHLGGTSLHVRLERVTTVDGHVAAAGVHHHHFEERADFDLFMTRAPLPVPTYSVSVYKKTRLC